MAQRHAVGGWFAALLVFAAVAAGLVPLIFFATAQGGEVRFDVVVWRTLQFTLVQAGLSTLLSVVPAVLVARHLSVAIFS
jgi:thiamine transport system permease protein